MKFEITKEDKEAIKSYKNEKNFTMYRLLQDPESELSLLTSQENIVEYTKDEVVQNIEKIKTIYEAMVKNFYHNPRTKMDFL